MSLAASAAELARAQLERDRRATRRMPALLRRKIARMTASPFAFLRGSAPLFYALLDEHPELCLDAPGDGWVVGDAHVENFGAFRSARSDAPVFDVNDFDECGWGPLWLDVLRLTTSVVLASREIGATGPVTVDLVRALFEAWEAGACGRRLPPAPREVARLLAAVGARKARDLLRGRVEEHRHHARFTRGDRYLPLPSALASGVPRAYRAYLASLDAHERPQEDRATILDVAWRVAGTGSLGKVRVAVLAKGKDAPWIFDLKEQGETASRRIAARGGAPAARVVLGARAMLAHPPRALGTTRLAGLSMLGRRLSPMEDKLALAHVPREELTGLVRYLGALLGAAHRRGAAQPPRAWSPSSRARLFDAAASLAGIHEAAYLAYSALAPR